MHPRFNGFTLTLPERNKMGLSTDKTKELKNKLRLIENLLRFQVLTNIDANVTSVGTQVETMKELVSALPDNYDDFKLFYEEPIDDCETDDTIQVTKYKRWLADLNICINEIQRVSRGAEEQVKGPVRAQVRALAGTRNHTLKDY